jgi:hypothetical protein
MRRVLVIVGVLLGVLLGGLIAPGAASAAPVSAAESSSAAASVATASTGCKDPNNWWDNLRLNAGSMETCDTDLGWPWEAGDALCTIASDAQGVPELVSCTGATPETSGSIECWVNVATDTRGTPGTSTTVCTSSTDQTHRDTIQLAAATGAPGTLQGHCGLADASCVMFEGWSRALVSDAVGGLVGILGTGHFTSEGALWDAATNEWSYWVWAILGIMFCATVWSITQAMYSKDRADLVTAITRTVISWPMIFVTFWLGSKLVGIFDDWTLYTLTRGDSLAGVFRRFSQIIYAGGEGHYFMTFLIALTIWVGTKLLLVVFALRTLGLAALLMVGPVAWMLFPVRGIGPQWVVGYFSAGFTLLLSGPLTMGFISLILRGLGNLSVLWSPEAWPLLLGLVLVVFAPFAVMSLFSFAGAAAADRLGGAAGNAARSGMNIARNAGRNVSGALGRTMRWSPAGRTNATPAGKGGKTPAGRQPGPAGRPKTQSGSGRGSSKTNGSSATKSPPSPVGRSNGPGPSSRSSRPAGRSR